MDRLAAFRDASFRHRRRREPGEHARVVATLASSLANRTPSHIPPSPQNSLSSPDNSVGRSVEEDDVTASAAPDDTGHDQKNPMPGYAARARASRRQENYDILSRWHVGDQETGEKPEADYGARDDGARDDGARDDSASDDSDAEDTAQADTKPRKKKRRKIGRPQDALPGARRRGERRVTLKSRRPGRGQKPGVKIGQGYLDRNSGAPRDERGEVTPQGTVRCDKHDAPADVGVTKKAGPNKGRRFYRCSLTDGRKCNFFAWVDEVDIDDAAAFRAASRALRALEQVSVGVQANAGTDGAIAPAVIERDTALEDGLERLTGFTVFRVGQRESIEKILRGESCVTILPTGGGKSLCYVLPAAMLPGTTLVVSPLLALMQDQLARLPPGLPAASIHSGMRRAAQRQVETDFVAGRIKVLFVAPERLELSTFLEKLACPGRISLVCVDEAHCISDWSHNFRPVYRKLRWILDHAIRPKSVLALTATATVATLRSICDELRIPQSNVVAGGLQRPNLTMTLSRERDKLSALRRLFTSERFREGAVIVYVSRQRDADEVAGYLRSCSLDAASYHAGHPHKLREKVQDEFVSGKVRILVATVAFGMGLDKRDIRGVIHYSIPRSPEAYSQEIGRAGRDGLPSECHLLLQRDDLVHARSQAYSDGVDNRTLLSLLTSVLRSERDIEQDDTRVYRVFDLDVMEREFDMRREVIETTLTHLERLLVDRQDFDSEVSEFHVAKGIATAVRVQYKETMSKVISRSGSELLGDILDAGKGSAHAVNVDVFKASQELKIRPSEVMEEIENAQAQGLLSFETRGTDNPVVGYCCGVCDEDFVDRIAESLHEKLGRQERNLVYKADQMAEIMSLAEEVGSDRQQQSSSISRSLEEYFQADIDPAHIAGHRKGSLNPLNIQFNQSILAEDIRGLLGSPRGITLRTPRQVTRILHGISSPNFAAQDWFDCPHWRRYSFLDFDALLDIVKQEVRAVRTAT